MVMHYKICSTGQILNFQSKVNIPLQPVQLQSILTFVRGKCVSYNVDFFFSNAAFTGGMTTSMRIKLCVALNIYCFSEIL